MADIKFEAVSAKDGYEADVATAEEYGLTATNKGVINVPASASSDVNGSTIDITGTAFFKTVSVESGYSGTIAVAGNGTVANVVYAGGAGTSIYGGDPGDKNGKVAVAADKFYGGAGNDTYVYAANGGKDAIYNYSSGDAAGGNDVIVIKGYDADKHSLSFVDKNGGITVTLSDNTDSTVSKNSVLTVDGKTATASGGFTFLDGSGDEILTYGLWDKEVFYYADKKGKDDTSTVTVNGAAAYEGVINIGHVTSTAKNIYVIDSTSGDGEETVEAQAFHIVGNGNANSITIGAGGGTLDGGYGAKATADKLLGTTSGEVVFVYDAINGGKDTIGDAKLTQYNYKAGDKIVITNGTVDTAEGATANSETHTAVIANNSGNVVITFDKNNTLTINGGVGKPISIYYVDDEGNISDEPAISEWGDVLQTGLNYDAKLSKITADDAIIQTTPTVPGSKIVTQVIDGEVWSKTQVVPIFTPITLGGEDATYATSVKEIDLSASSAAVVIDTSEEAHASVTSIKVGTANSTVIANDAVTQTYTAGNGNDKFILSAKKLDIDKFKGETITNMGAGDVLQINDLEDDDVISVTEKGKDLIVAINGTTFVTLKNATFDADNKLSIVNEEGEELKNYPFTIGGVGYGMNAKGTAVDKTAITLGGSVASSIVSAEDFGGATIKKVDATAVTAVSGNAGIEIDGSSAANTMLAPTAAKIATTLNGGAGNDILTSGAGKTTFVFTALTAGKKDTINDYKPGDVIVIDQSSIEGGASFEADDDGHGIITYEGSKGTVDGFNDSKSAVVISVNAKNSITVNNAAGKEIILQDADTGDTYSFGHVLPSSALAYDAKNTSITLAADATTSVKKAYSGNINLSDYGTYYDTVKKVDLSGNTLSANIYGNTLANEFIAGSGGGILDGGTIYDAEAAVVLTDAKGSNLKPTADKLTGGTGADTYVYDVSYGKDSFLSFGSEDVVSIGHAFGEISQSDISITDKGNVLTVVISGDAIETDTKNNKTAINTTANSTFTITKRDSSTAVNFVLSRGDEDATPVTFTYGDMTGLTTDSKYGTLSVDASVAAGSVFDVSNINSQPKVIDGRAATAGVVLIGNANADNIYGGGTADGAGSTLFGGTAGTKAVKDALYGSDGKDYFLFTSQGGEKGKETDIVYNYKAGDVIVLDKAPDTFKADGKTFTLTWNDTPAGGKATQSTLVINGANSDNGAMKKFDNIDSNVSVTFAIGEFIDDNGNIDLTAALDATDTYTFKVDAKATDADVKAATAALKKGVEWGDWADYLVEEEESEELAATSDQYAASAWFEEAVSTDNVIGSELDSILDAKGSTTDALEQVNGDAFFTGIGQQADNSLLTSYAARHRAKK